MRTLSRFKRNRNFSVESLEGRQVLSTLFVSPTGSDKNLGTAAAPYLTIQKAANVAKPGDTVDVQPGNYNGFVLGWDTPKSGLPGSPITFKGEPGANITYQNSKTPDGIDIEGGSYITIEGFKVTGTLRAGIRANNGTNVIIQNNVCDSNRYWGIETSFVNNLLIQNNITSNSLKQHGIYVSNTCSNPQVLNNVIFGNKNCGLHMNGDVSQGGVGVITGAVVEGNIIYNNGVSGGAGINLDGVQNSLISNNLLFNNYHTGIALFQGDASGSSINDTVINNTVIMAPTAKSPAIELLNAATGNTIERNILFVTTTKYPCSLSVTQDSLPGLVSDYNVVNSYCSANNTSSLLTLAKWQAQTGQDKHSAMSTASTFQFVNSTANDFELKFSPIANVGSQLLPVGAIDPTNPVAILNSLKPVNLTTTVLRRRL